MYFYEHIDYDYFSHGRLNTEKIFIVSVLIVLGFYFTHKLKCANKKLKEMICL